MEYNTLVNPKVMIALEEELSSLKKENGIETPAKWWHKVGDFICEKADRQSISINRKKYIKLAVSCGWFCGGHLFYAKKKIQGLLYILFLWTGIPLAMTLIDLMIILPMKADENGNVEI
ncbi:MAG: TM2 domain-containing protein [Anaerotignaceae bacterium]